jgi:hypothetical protein
MRPLPNLAGEDSGLIKASDAISIIRQGDYTAAKPTSHPIEANNPEAQVLFSASSQSEFE